MTDEEQISVITEVLDEFAGLPKPVGELGQDTDLFAAGMTSFASVSVMLGLEERLGVMFPESMLKRSTFASISAIAGAIGDLRSDLTDPAVGK